MRAPLISLAVMLALAACDRQGQTPRPGNDSGAVTVDVPQAIENVDGVTPMAERVAVLGFLNKRNGIVRDLTLKPGQAIRVGDAIVRLRACETSAPWENERLTGAFVQLDVEQPDDSWRRVFSGWLYKESPSLNVVEHPVYDVWPKSCAMKWPDAPDAPARPSASSSRSSASNSGGGSSPVAETDTGGDEPAAPEAEPIEPVAPEPSAEPNNPT